MQLQDKRLIFILKQGMHVLQETLAIYRKFVDRHMPTLLLIFDQDVPYFINFYEVVMLIDGLGEWCLKGWWNKLNRMFQVSMTTL